MEATVEPTYVLAVWHVAERRWAALARSAEVSKVDALHDQLVALVCVYTEVVKVERDDDDLIEATLSTLAEVHPAAVVDTYLDLVEYVVDGRGPAAVKRILM